MKNNILVLLPILIAAPAIAQDIGCQIGDIAGLYDSQWGQIQCAANDNQLECCYGNLDLCDKRLFLSLNLDTGELVGRWEYSNGAAGSAKFAVDSQCDLRDGSWGSGANPTSSWRVGNRIVTSKSESESIEELSAKEFSTFSEYQQNSIVEGLLHTIFENADSDMASCLVALHEKKDARTGQSRLILLIDNEFADAAAENHDILARDVVYGVTETYCAQRDSGESTTSATSISELTAKEFDTYSLHQQGVIVEALLLTIFENADNGMAECLIGLHETKDSQTGHSRLISLVDDELARAVFDSKNHLVIDIVDGVTYAHCAKTD